MSAIYEWIRNLTAFFLFLSVLENLLPGKTYGKYIHLFAGMILILLALQPFSKGSNLEELLARNYEELLIQKEAEELKAELGAAEKKRLEQILSQYETAVEEDVTRLAESCGVQVKRCQVFLENQEESAKFGGVQMIRMILEAGTQEEVGKQLKQQIRDYYGLEEQDVEIEIAGGERPVDFSVDRGRDPLYSGVSGRE